MTAADPDPGDRCPASASCEPAGTGGDAIISVLYVDDEPCLLDVAKIFLESQGNISVLTSESGSTALALMEERTFDAIIADYQMPGMDGIEFLREVRSADTRIPFILFTGKGREEIAIEAIRSGADLYVQKGGSITAQFADLMHMIRVLVERIRYREALAETAQKFSALFESSSDAVMVAGIGEGTVRIREANARAFSLFALNRGGGTTDDPGYILPDLRQGDNGPCTLEKYLLRHAGDDPPASSWTFREADGSTTGYDLAVRRIGTGNGATKVLLVARAVTGEERGVEALALANHKLSLLAAITRHDIRNRLMILEAYLTLVNSDPENPVAKDYTSRMPDLVRGIRQQIEFTREYQDVGKSAPQWQDICEVVERARVQDGRDALLVRADACAGIGIFADRMLEYVFYNLIQNALLHGGHASAITFSVNRDDGPGCTLIVEDDGEGILPEDKERIFERGFGRNSGLGLYLAKEILSLTGISIRETGMPGKGARFELLVPPSAFRAGIQQ